MHADGSGAALALSLILPAHNEAERLPATIEAIHRYLETSPLGDASEVLVVDNASTDGTGDVVSRLGARFPQLRLVRTEGRGKGLAVQAGMLAARGQVRLFGDADLSWPVAEIGRFHAMVADGNVPVVIGSRQGSGARRVGEPFYRHLMGRVFNHLVQLLAVPGVEDTQCGFKAFRSDAAEAIFPRLTIRGFGFDVEALYLARSLGYPVKEVPLLWEHKLHSRVDPVRDSLRMVADVLRVRSNAARGLYRRTTG